MQTDSRQNLARAVPAVIGLGLLIAGLAAAAPPREGALPDGQGQAPPSEEIVVSSRVDKVRVAESEPLTFSVTIAGPIRATPRVTLPSLEGFQVVSTSQSQQMSVRGGQMQSAITLQYLLVPTAPGRRTLGPVAVEQEGHRYETAPIAVEVQPAPPGPRRYPPVRGGTVL